MYKKHFKNFIRLILTPIFVGTILLVTFYPIFFLIISTFKTKDDYYNDKLGLPVKWILANYIEIFKGDLARHILNSIIVIVIALTISLLVSNLAGFTISKLDIRFKREFFWFVLIFMAMPSQIFIIPLFVLFSNLELVNSFIGLALIYATMTFPLGLILMVSYFDNIPSSLFEAAKIDGASNTQMYFRIALPMSVPILFTFGVLGFVFCWSELIFGLIFIQNEKLKTIMPYLASVEHRIPYGIPNTPLMNTGLVIGILIPITIYLFFQKYLVRGITLGAVKE